MQSILYKAKYLLALSTDTMTDEIRKDYADSILLSSAEAGYRIMNQVVVSFFQSNKYSADELKNKVELEYNGLGLIKVLGDYSKYSSLLNFMIDIYMSEHSYFELVNLYKDCIDFADKQENEVKMCLYNGVLKAIVCRNLILEDIQFSEMITGYVSKNLVSDEYKGLTDLINYVLNSVIK